MRVLIRADASPTIGSGHIARCLTLARVLRQHGAQVAFACRTLPGHRLQSLDADGFQTFALPDRYAGEDPGQAIESLLPWQADIAALESVLGAEPAFDWIIVDHYGLDYRWQTAARQWAPRIAAIDDLATRRYAVDLLLNQNLSGTPEAYASLLQGHCRSLLGPRYALLRDEFRGPAISVKPLVRRVLVNFGGFDAAAQTHKTMLAMVDLNELDVDFVAGADNPAWAQMQVLAASRPNWRLHSYVSDFARLMTQADLCIGAGGGTSWERAALGLPTICIAVSNNQQANAQVMASAGAHIYLGTGGQVDTVQLGQAIAFVVANQGVRQSLAERSLALVDGRGAERVAVAMSGAVLPLRMATMDDAHLLFEGRNAESVRRWALQSQAISWQSHQAWLAARLFDDRCLLLIAEAADGPIGMVRYDRDGEQATVSIYLFEGCSGLGWGRVLLARGEAFVTRHWPGLLRFNAQVLAANQASLKLFHRAGYQQDACVFTRVLKDVRND